MNKVDGKVALVTGGGSGIGRAICELIAKAGAQVVVTDINLISAEDTVKNIVGAGGKAVAIKQDVASEDSWHEVMAFTAEHYGKLDILVNNAGIATSQEIKDTSLKTWKSIHSVNLEGVFLGVRSAIDLMKGSGGGSIVNISSMYGLVGSGGRRGDDFFKSTVFQSAYSASKGGVTVFTKSAAIECARLGFNIRVNSVHPGAVMAETITPSNDKEQRGLDAWNDLVPLGRFAKPAEIAKGVLFLASEDASYITGAELVIDGGITAS